MRFKNSLRNAIGAVACCSIALIPGAQGQKPAPHVLMISVDGMRPDYITQADAHGLKVPVLRGFVQNGTYADGVIGILPTVTHPSHTTLITGVWPIEHGIYDNTRFNPGAKGNEEWYWFAPDIKVQTLWEAASSAGITTASVQWPVSVYARGVDYLIPAYPVYTKEDRPLLESMARPDGYLDQLEKTVGPFYIIHPVQNFDELLTKTSVALIQDKHPGFMTVHLVSLDSIEHATGPFSPESDATMEAIDGMIGRLVDAERAADPNAIVVVVSDHGFAPVHTRVNLLIPFIKAGLITLAPSKPNTPLSIASWRAALWNADGSAYVMLKDPSDKQTHDAVASMLEQLSRDPQYGIEHILTHEQIVAQGGYPDAAFMVTLKSGFAISEALQGNVVNATGSVGTHGYAPDVPDMRSSFFVLGAGIAAHHDVGIIDMRQIAPTVASFLGISLPAAKQPAVNCKP